MAYSPIALTIPEYDRTLYANWWLKAYYAGTTTPLAMATDATGGTTAAKFELNTQGFPITAGSARLIPFINGTYDLWLFPTASEADANDTTNAIQFADNLNADPLYGGAVLSVGTIALLRLETPDQTISTYLESHSFAGDAGGGNFYAVTGAAPGTYVDDDGRIIVPTGGDGSAAFIRADSTISVTQFGAAGSPANDTAAFQAAVVAANNGVSVGTGDGGTVFVPDGIWLINPIGIRDTAIIGESINGTTIKAHTAYASGPTTLLDASLDRDGSTANTSGGQGVARNLTIDGDSKGYNGLKTYGGGVDCNNLKITGCIEGFTGSLMIWSNVSNVYSYSNTGNGFVMDGDSTSTTFENCWADSNGDHGFEIKRATYCSFISCASQNSTNEDWYVGDSTGIITSYSVTFITCGSEGSNNVPFYFKKVRDITIIDPRVIDASATHDYMVFDNCGGSLINYSHLGTPGAGKFSLSIINHAAGNGAITIIGSTVTVTAGAELYWNSLGSSVNSVRGIRDYSVTFNDATAVNRMNAEVASVDGFFGLVVAEESGGTRSMGLSRAGSNVFRGTAFNNPATNMNNNEFSIAVDTAGSQIKFTMKDTGGTVKTGTVAMT